MSYMSDLDLDRWLSARKKNLSLKTPQQQRKRRRPTGKIVIPYAVQFSDECTDLLWKHLSQHFEMPSIF